MDFSLFLLVTLLLSSQTHARESQFFNKASPTTTTTTSAANAVAESNQPKFVQDDGNTYGLYAHDSSTAAAVEKPLHDYFPNNYNQAAAALEDANEAAFPKRNTYYNGGGGGFNIRPQRQFGGGFDQPQGMSDTRFLENGKYFYDVNTERYVSNHPYQVMRGDRRRNEDYNKNFDGGGGGYGFNGGRYQNNLDVFDDEVDNLP